MKPQKRFPFVDALRGIAALGVVLYHATGAEHVPSLLLVLPDSISALVRHGNLGVAIFFVLSGFVISHSVYSERVTLGFVGRFMLRRSLRLDPPYWAAIALTLAFAALSAKVVANKAAPEVSVGQLVAHVLYLQDMLSYPQINVIFWTLCLEVQFYLVYVVLLWLSRNDPQAPLQGMKTMAVLGGAAVISLLWPTGVLTSPLWPGSFLPLWHGFLLGAGAYWAWRNPKLAPFFLGYMLVIGAFALARADEFSIVCAVTAGILWLAAVSNRMLGSLDWRPIQFLGLISYSLYLTHNPITGATFRVGYMMTGHSLLWEAVWWAVSVAACISFAAVMWWLIERPSMGLARRISYRQKPREAVAGT